MYKILIADDERLERTALVQVLEEQMAGVFEIQEAENGRIALETSHTFRPDIIMMDIKMPAMNGIDAAREIMQAYPNTKIIMLTGFTYFHYAKECVSIGAMDFLVKPTTNDAVIEVLVRAMQEVDEIRIAQQSVQAEQEKLKLADHYIENEYLSELFFGGADSETAAQRLAELGVGAAYYTVAIFFPDIGYGKDGLGRGVKKCSRALIRQSAEELAEDLQILQCEHYSRIYLLFCSDTPLTRAALGNWLDAYLKNITQQQNCIAGMGVSLLSGEFSALPQLVQQAYKAYSTSNTIQFYEPQRGVEAHVSQYAIEQKLCALLRQGEYTELMNQLRPAMDDIFAQSEEAIGEVAELLMLLNRVAAEHISVESTAGLYRKLDQIAEPARVKNFAVRFVQTNIDRMIHKETENASDWSKVAKELIQNNYTKDLAMEDVARQVGFSTYYFSRLFKQTFGMSFVDYLTKMRLEKAKTILRTQNGVSVKEVCFAVGYSEPNYFARVFKKETGLTPSEYQKNAHILN